MLDALESCGSVASQSANGERVSPAQAAEAAGQAVKCFAKYDYEQQEWFIDAFEAVTERETNGIGADDEPHGPPADEGSDDHRVREETT